MCPYSHCIHKPIQKISWNFHKISQGFLFASFLYLLKHPLVIQTSPYLENIYPIIYREII